MQSSSINSQILFPENGNLPPPQLPACSSRHSARFAAHCTTLLLNWPIPRSKDKFPRFHLTEKISMACYSGKRYALEYH